MRFFNGFLKQFFLFCTVENNWCQKFWSSIKTPPPQFRKKIKMDVLSNTAWNFNETEYESKEDFNEEISRYQIQFKKDATSWNPDEIVVENETVDLVFMAWIEEDGLEENETLLEDPDFFDDESKSEFGLFQADIQVRFEADNGKNFSALELMFKIDQQMKPKELGDELFFEGLGSLESETDIPKFYLFCGISN